MQKNKTKQATLNEETMLNETAKYIEDMGTSNTIPNLLVNPPKEKSEIEKSRDSGKYMDATTTLKDDDGNLIKVPKGFKIAEDSEINVTEGIVIEDIDIISGIGNNGGNQYVWISVGNGGYYIAHYEASYGTNGKANSKVSNNYSETIAPTTEGTLWNYITQINAATASRNLYTMVTTYLITSYARNTAILYIQNFSRNNDYSRQISKNTSLANTRTIEDEVCKINDMATNTFEWTTEYSTYTFNSDTFHCVSRDSDCYYGLNYTNKRYYNYATDSYKNITFRITLYM